jgi:DNA-nicking Smr family endonuclease
MGKRSISTSTRSPKAGVRALSLGELAPAFAQIREAERIERERIRRAAEQAARAAREASLFRTEVADATPLTQTGRIVPERERPAPKPRQREQDEREVLEQSISDEIDIERFLDTDDTLSWRREGIGPDVVRRLRRGEWTVRSQIDLHGLRVDQARAALVEFLSDAVRSEWRCLRIIHGKGLGSPSREPVLKGKVKKWLAQRAEVLAFCQARPNDGGSGALIVLLQAPRGQRQS